MAGFGAGLGRGAVVVVVTRGAVVAVVGGVTTGAVLAGISSMNSSATYIVSPFMAIPMPT